MSRSIGNVNFTLFKGRVANLKLRSKTWEVFGLDGIGVFTGGYGDGDFQLETTFYATDPGASQSHILACEALQGTIVTIVDALNRSFSGCFIEHLETQDCETPIIWNGNQFAMHVKLQWRIRSVE